MSNLTEQRLIGDLVENSMLLIANREYLFLNDLDSSLFPFSEKLSDLEIQAINRFSADSLNDMN